MTALTPNTLSKPQMTAPMAAAQFPFPDSRSTDVISTPGIPHGTIRSNWVRSFVTFRANPCHVTHCFTWIPMLAILRPRVHTPV